MSEVKPVKNNLLKLLSVAVCGAFTASYMSTYISALDLEYDVEPSSEIVVQDDTAALFNLSAIPEIEYNISDVSEPVTVNKTENIEGTLLASFIPLKGKGTEASPFLINTAEELQSVGLWVESGIPDYTEGYYRLENDIDLNGVEWEPIGTYQNSSTYSFAFKGVFDGNNKTISNFKITRPQVYAGFFGLTYNSSIYNLTLSDFTIDQKESTTMIYIGGLVARSLSMGEDERSVISNCHVKNSNITVKNNYRIYGAGGIGYLHSSAKSAIIISNCSVDAMCNFTVNDHTTNGAARSMIRSGGLIGYLGITNGEITIKDSSSNATIINNFTNALSSNRNDVHSGAFAGDFALSSDNPTSYRSKLIIDSSYSTNMVYSNSDGDSYLGGFTGYLVSQASDISIANSHTTSSVYGQSTSNTAYLGGFSGIIGAAGDSDGNNVGTIEISNTYSGGNVIDLKSKDSCAGKMTAYIEQDVSFVNCYTMIDSVITSKNGTMYKKNNMTRPALLPKEDNPFIDIASDLSGNIQNYVGFDLETWKNPEAPYNLPVLINNPVNQIKLNLFYFEEGAPVKYSDNVAYNSVPTKPEFVPDSLYIFSHWSSTIGGADFFDGVNTVTSDAIFFPNLSSEYKSFDISFSANGEVFTTSPLQYDSIVIFPDPPIKPSDSFFRYTFSHWSKTPDGNVIDITKEKVKGEATYYAVYVKVATGVWDGATATPYINGNGTEESPYEISDAYHLAYLAKTVNDGTITNKTYYSITKDIDLGGFEWTPCGTVDKPFTGVINGNGYAIYNFKITNKETTNAGIFGYAENAHISNLEVSNFNIVIESDTKDTYNIGGIIGCGKSKEASNKLIIENCFVDGTISVNAGIAYVGSIAGNTSDSDLSCVIIKNCYSTADISVTTTDNSTVGGITGKFDSLNPEFTKITNCYYSGNISCISNISVFGGGIVGYLLSDTNWAELNGECVLFSENDTNTDSIIDCIFAGEKITLSLGHTSYGGYIYGHKNQDATVRNCGYINTATITASNINSNTEVKEITKQSELFDGEYLATNFNFDFDNLWMIRDNELPVLQIFNQAKNMFRINEFSLEESNLNVNLKICYRDLSSYLVLLGAYDERGKMIAFRNTLISTPSEITQIEYNIENLDKAVTCTLSIIDPITLKSIEIPISLTK